MDTPPTGEKVKGDENRFSRNFKDRFVCKCLLRGLDSNGTDMGIQSLSYIDFESILLYDSQINKILPRVMRLIYLDSVSKVGRVAENAQGYDLYRNCLKYSRSSEMDSVIRENRKTWDTIKDVEKYVTDRMLY